MQELLFWLIVFSVISFIGVILAIRSHRPVEVDIEWPLISCVVRDYLTEEQLRRDLASVDSVLPTPSTGYTPLLDDDPYVASEPEEVKLPEPQVDLRLIRKEYR